MPCHDMAIVLIRPEVPSMNGNELALLMHIIMIWNLLLLVIQAQDSNLLNEYIIFSVYIFGFLFLEISSNPSFLDQIIASSNLLSL